MKWEKLDAIEREIYDALHEEGEDGKPSEQSQDLLDGLQTPCSVFVTFCTEEGYQRACEYNNQIDPSNPLVNQDMVIFDKFLGGEIEIHEASPPSDIIWENRQLSRNQRLFRGSVSFGVIAIMLFISGIIIFLCSSFSTQLKTKYPNIVCDGDHGFLASEYGKTDWETSWAKMLDGAAAEFEENE